MFYIARRQGAGGPSAFINLDDTALKDTALPRTKRPNISRFTRQFAPLLHTRTSSYMRQRV